jgi:hypothetical protein
MEAMSINHREFQWWIITVVSLVDIPGIRALKRVLFDQRNLNNRDNKIIWYVFLILSILYKLKRTLYGNYGSVQLSPISDYYLYIWKVYFMFCVGDFHPESFNDCKSESCFSVMERDLRKDVNMLLFVSNGKIFFEIRNARFL